MGKRRRRNEAKNKRRSWAGLDWAGLLHLVLLSGAAHSRSSTRYVGGGERGAYTRARAARRVEHGTYDERKGAGRGEGGSKKGSGAEKGAGETVPICHPLLCEVMKGAFSHVLRRLPNRTQTRVHLHTRTPTHTACVHGLRRYKETREREEEEMTRVRCGQERTASRRG